MVKRWRLLLGTIGLLLGCSGGSEPGEVRDLTGDWLLRDSSNTLLVGQSNRCVLWDRPVQVTPLEGDTLYNGTEQAGGMIQCELNGTVSPPGPVQQRPILNYLIYLRGDSVVIFDTFGVRVYYGTMVHQRRLAGRRDSTFNGRYGTWALTR